MSSSVLKIFTSFKSRYFSWKCWGCLFFLDPDFLIYDFFRPGARPHFFRLDLIFKKPKFSVYLPEIQSGAGILQYKWDIFFLWHVHSMGIPSIWVFNEMKYTKVDDCLQICRCTGFGRVFGGESLDFGPLFTSIRNVCFNEIQTKTNEWIGESPTMLSEIGRRGGGKDGIRTSTYLISM